MIFTVAIVVLLGFLYILNQHKHSFWIKRGFIQLEPKFLIGDIGPLLTMKKSLGQFFQSIYVNHKEHRAIGIYMSYQPVVVVNDPILLQHVMVRDFNSFHDRPLPSDLEHDTLQNHLFHIAGQRWRDLRVKLSPTFTSGKLKGMFSVINCCGKVLEEYLEKNVRNGIDVFEFRELFARLNTSIISSVAFGIENDCVNEPDHIFRRMGAKNFEVNWRTIATTIFAIFVPAKLNKLIKFKITNPEVEKFVFSVVKQTVEYREKNNVERNDFMQLLIQLKDKGYVSVDKEEKDTDSVEQDVKKLSFNDLAANVFVFFQAGKSELFINSSENVSQTFILGFETSSSTLAFCLFELARNPEIQKKAQLEIDRALKASGQNDFTYDILSELKYLQYCIDEALRIYPIVPLLFRVCTEEFKIPDTEMIIPKGTGIMIPVLGFHRDPDIFENPMEFRPERFVGNPTGSSVKGCYYLPFGNQTFHISSSYFSNCLCIRNRRWS